MNRDELTHAVDVVLHAEQQWPFEDWQGVAAVSAAGTLARHIQRLYDPTPVDAQWMLSVGGKSREDHMFPDAIAVGDIDFWNDQLWIDAELLIRTPTRGDVRRLCDALGIELREEP